jgi:hypothetical protein
LADSSQELRFMPRAVNDHEKCPKGADSGFYVKVTAKLIIKMCTLKKDNQFKEIFIHSLLRYGI